MLADQVIDAAIIDTGSQKFQGLGSKESRISLVDSLGFCSLPPEVAGAHVPDEVPPSLQPQRADCSSESCLTSLESPSGAKKRMLSLDAMVAPLLWSEANARTQGFQLTQVNPHGIARYGI